MPPAPEGGGRRRRGCRRYLFGLLIVLAVVAVVLVIGFVVMSRLTSNRPTSGARLPRRPVSSSTTTTTVAERIPESVAGVTPLGRGRMLVSVAHDPPTNPCSKSGNDFDIESMGADGSDRRPISGANSSDEELWPRLSPDRRRYVFYRAPQGTSGEQCRYATQELWMANVDGSGVRRIFSNARKREVATERDWPTAGQSLVQGLANWSPDGVHVVIVLGHYPSLGPVPLMKDGQTQLFVLNVDTGDLRQVTDRRDSRGRGVSSDPSFTPDGAHLVFVGCPDRQPSCDDTQILSVPADGDKVRSSTVVFDGPGRNPNDVYVSPDGRSVEWIEVGLLGTGLYVAPFHQGRRSPRRRRRGRRSRRLRELDARQQTPGVQPVLVGRSLRPVRQRVRRLSVTEDHPDRHQGRLHVPVAVTDSPRRCR
ncbi:MAG: hypothetical protein R2698_12020 [Microthrixaceae bacterium]